MKSYATRQRRNFLPCLLGLCLLLLVMPQASPVVLAQGERGYPSLAYRLSPQDDKFLEDLSQRAFRFFWEQGNTGTGLVADRSFTDGRPYPPTRDHYKIASSAATGFGLTALCIAAERGWISRGEAHERVRAALDFYANKSVHERGWFYHFVDIETGERRWRSEISSIDTTLLLGGVLTARQYFRDDPDVVGWATKIYERIDFPWMLNRHPTLLSMGWHPESQFIKSRWDTYSEHPLLYLLAVASPTYPIKPASWYAWERDWNTYKNYRYLGKAPLFTHQYSHAWVDFRDRRENRPPHVDYFDNSVTATRAHRQFCIDLSRKFPGYSENVWGITASDSVKGYRAWGGPPATPDIDGSVVPCAAAGSLMFTPEISLAALRTMHDKFGSKIYGRYGFTDAFNPNNGWVNPDVIGIDVGITILSAENLRTGNVWRWFMRNPEIPRALDLVGLRRQSAARPRPPARRRSNARAVRNSSGSLRSRR